MQGEAIYRWERLEVFQLVNQVSRLLGRLLVSMPSRFHIQLHSLIAQVVVVSHAIPGAHRDRAPDEPPVPLEERRAWLMIGFVASETARTLMTELGRAPSRSRPDIDSGLKLLARIEADFKKHLEGLDGGPSEVSSPVHLA